MNEAPGLRHRAQTRGEEIANSVSHGIGLLAALVALPVLVIGAAPHGTSAMVGAGIFGVTMALLYLTSTLYHAMARDRVKHFFRILDHGAIYLLIAGTYTPFTLNVLPAPWGWRMFALVWTLAVIGVVLKATPGPRRPILSTLLYIGMGWLIVIAIRPLLASMPLAGLWWLLGGGLAYTGGTIVYAMRRLPYGHFIWHLFVMTGSACHYVAVLLYAL